MKDESKHPTFDGMHPTVASRMPREERLDSEIVCDLRIDRSMALAELLEACRCLLISEEDVEDTVEVDFFILPPSSFILPHVSFR